MNKFIGIGNLTKDPELRTTQSGINTAIFAIAINNGKDKEGNQKEADYINIYAYEKQAENVSKYCKKGSKVCVEGRLHNSVTEKEDGTKYYNSYISADRVEFLNTKTSTNTIPEPDYVSAENEQTSADNTAVTTTDPFEEFGQSVALDDSQLPF